MPLNKAETPRLKRGSGHKFAQFFPLPSEHLLTFNLFVGYM